MRYDLTDFEWHVIEPLKPIRRPSKSRIGASLVVSFRRCSVIERAIDTPTPLH